MRTLGKHHPLWKQLRRLREPAGRREEGRFLIEGARTLEEALRARFPVEMLLIAEGKEDLELVREFERSGTELYRVPAESLERLGPAVTSQGLLGVARPPRPALRAGRRILLLDGVSDPGNLGTLIRCAWAARAAGVLLHGTADPHNAKVVRASAGGLFHVPVLPVHPDVLRTLAEQGFSAVAAVARGGRDLYQTRLPEQSLLLLGSEARGLSEELLAMAHLRVTIPLEPGCDSLNVAISGALLLFEHRRQHGT